MCLAQRNNAVTLVRLLPATSQTQSNTLILSHCAPVLKTDCRLCRLKVLHNTPMSTFIKLPFVIKIFVLSIFERSLKTGSTVCSH